MFLQAYFYVFMGIRCAFTGIHTRQGMYILRYPAICIIWE